MRSHLLFFSLIFHLLSFVFLHAQWPTTPDSAIFVDGGFFPYLAVDPHDESITVIYLQGDATKAKKYDRYGIPLWGGNSVTLSDTAWGFIRIQWNVSFGQWGAVVSDDSGGAIACWEDYRNAEIEYHNGEPVPQGSEIYIQRVDVNGQIRYGANGKKISGPASEGFHNIGDMKKDYHGGFVVGFDNDTTATTSVLKRFNINGNLQWERYFNGSYIDVNAVDQQGNIFVSTIANQPGKRHKLDLTGNYLWPDTLVGIIPDLREYRLGGAFPDGMGGVIGARWQANHTIKINRADSTGQFVFGNGIILPNISNANLKVAPDLLGGLYLTYVKGGPKIQKISNSGDVIFDSSGIAPCYMGNCGGYNFMVSDQNYGVINIFIWNRNPPSQSYYAQRIDSNGNRLWDSTAVEFYSTTLGDPHFIFWRSIVSDRRGGAIFAWNENGILLKQICRHGILGEIDPPLGIDKKIQSQTSALCLYQNYPNPFNSSTNITYHISTSAKVHLKIYDTLGQEVKTLMDEYQSAGNYQIEWNGKNNAGQTVSSGIYFYMLAIDNQFTSTKKLLYLK